MHKTNQFISISVRDQLKICLIYKKLYKKIHKQEIYLIYNQYYLTNYAFQKILRKQNKKYFEYAFLIIQNKIDYYKFSKYKKEHPIENRQIFIIYIKQSILKQKINQLIIFIFQSIKNMNKIGNYANYSEIKKPNSTFTRYSDRYKDFLQKALKNKENKFSQSFKIQLYKPPENKPFFIKIKTLGFGAFSSVNLVFQEKTHTIYALKVIPKSKFIKNKQMLQEQIKIHMALKHVNIIDLYHIYVQEGQLKLVLEYAENTLSDYLKTEKKITEKLASHFIRQILKALTYLHSLGITHRDIKLENTLLTSIGIIKLCDFGLASRKKQFDMSQFVGTVDYLSPETIKGAFYTQKVDIWAIGVILYELVNGKHFLDNLSQSQKYLYLSQFKPENIKFENISKELQNFFRKIFVEYNQRLSAAELLNQQFIKMHQS